MKQFILLVTFAVAALAAKMPVDRVPATSPVVGVPDPVKDTTPHNDRDVHHTTQHPVHHGQHGQHDSHEQKVPHVPQHVQHVVEQAHQHIPQVVNHHVGVKKSVQVPQVAQVSQVQHVGGGVGVSHVIDKVTVPATAQQHIHIDIAHHHADGNKHVAHNVPHVGSTVAGGVHQQQHPTAPQVVVDKVKKVEQHVKQVMQQAHQHIPQVINHHIAQKQKQKQQQQQQHQQQQQQQHKQQQQQNPHEQHAHHSTAHGQHSGVVDEKVPQGAPVPVPAPAPAPVPVPGHHIDSGVQHPVVTLKTTTM